MSDDDIYEIPLQDQRIFGAGIKRQRVKFVPSTSFTSVASESTATPSRSIGDLYLSMVLSKDAQLSTEEAVKSSLPSIEPTAFADNGLPKKPKIERAQTDFCEVCNLPLNSDPIEAVESSRDETSDVQEQRPKPKSQLHEASLAHQVCLAHSHPPSHIDRNRKGLAYLSAYGWDPDSRQGLGAEGQGIQFPIKTKPKDDKLGIGVVIPKLGDIKRREKIQKLDAGKVKKLQEKDKRRGEKLQEMFYRSEDLDRYLGGV